jgi:hypothetical protein
LAKAVLKGGDISTKIKANGSVVRVEARLGSPAAPSVKAKNDIWMA